MRSLVLVTLIQLTFGSFLWAGLTFESKELEQHAKPEDKVLLFRYEFKNESDKTVSITKVDAGCSCLKVKGLEKKSFAPGEEGFLEVDFALGTFSGKVDKVLFLWLKGMGSQSPTVTLKATVNIPALLSIEPATTKWVLSGEAQTQIIEVRVNGDQPVTLDNIVCTNPNFAVELITRKEGFEYDFEVTPKDTSKPGFGIVKFLTDSKVDRFKRGQAFMVISKNVKK